LSFESRHVLEGGEQFFGKTESGRPNTLADVNVHRYDSQSNISMKSMKQRRQQERYEITQHTSRYWN